jgi:glycosyltransferase involved in cell wall biosynthesis/ribosomal protein S18 acetylase RimI-like enzyme
MTRPIKVAHVATVDLTVRFLLLGQLKRLLEEGFDVTAISAPGPWTRDIEREGIRHLSWRGATRAWNPWADARAFVELGRILRAERFDLVHTHTPKAGLIGRVAARLAGVPCIVNTVHGFYAMPDDPPTKRVPIMTMEWIAANFSDLELFQSEEDLAWAAKRGIGRASQRTLLGNGTNLERFDPTQITIDRLSALRVELGIPEGAPVVGAVGRLVEEKGYRDLLRAAEHVCKALPNARFLLVGESDSEKADAITDAEIAAAGEHVVLAGWRQDVPDLLALMDVFVLASWREGMPRSAIEAAAMGKPLVLTDIRGCREVIRDGEEGFLVPPRDPGRLAEAILRLLHDWSLRRRMGRAARARALERFDEHRVAETVLLTYRDLLERKGLLRPGAPTRIRPAEVQDARKIARLHRQSLPGAFLPLLGDRFLAQLHRALATDPEAVSVVAVQGSNVVGFANGVISVRRFYRRFFQRYGLRAGLAAAARLIQPRVLRRALETTRYPRIALRLPDAEVLSVAVAPGWRSHGIGRVLVEQVLQDMNRRGANEIKVIVGEDNDGANRFYKALGFEPAGQISVHEGSLSNVWLIQCNSSSLSPSPSS